MDGWRYPSGYCHADSHINPLPDGHRDAMAHRYCDPYTDFPTDSYPNAWSNCHPDTYTGSHPYRGTSSTKGRFLHTRVIPG